MQKNSPLIFIHKSNIKDSQEYLYDVLKTARRYNPNMDIYLLGDDFNKNIAKECKVNFENYDKYVDCEEIKLFEKVFKLIKGEKHGAPEWIKFVFKRWFHIYNFLKNNNYNNFWTFDSDNLIICNLHNKEENFKNYDCTEQCDGACINGYVSNLKVVKGYLDKINELFIDDYYISKQIFEFNTIHPTYAFTEMRAYAEYKKQYSTIDLGMQVYPATSFKSILLQTIINNETFDPCLAQNSAKKICCEVEDSGYEMENGIKKLYYKDGKIYIKFLDTNNLIKVNSINMSWVNRDKWNEILNYINKYGEK